MFGGIWTVLRKLKGGRSRHMLLGAVCLTLAMGAANGAGLAATPAGSGLLGFAERRHEDLSAFTKWADMLSRHQWEEDHADRPQPCRVSADFSCPRDRWQNLIRELEGRPVAEQIAAVDAFFNAVPYVEDVANWGVPDYWATPREFLERGGDCEDYAIAKYFTLKALGVDPAAMRLMVVEDLNLRMPHAVLAVRLDDGVVVLDNQAARPMNAATVDRYRPIYSINQEAWWLHRATDPAISPAEGKAATGGVTAPRRP